MRSALALAFAAFCATATPASAHVPNLEPEVRDPSGLVEIAGPDVSRAFYGHLSEDEDGDLYRFSVSSDVTRSVGIIVPAYPEHSDFRPIIRIQAEGRLPMSLPDSDLDPRRPEFEPFSLTTFWWGGEHEIRFEGGRSYLLLVEPGPESSPSGRYVIVFGGPEVFSGDDALQSAADLPRIWFGAYGGAPYRMNLLAAAAIATPVLLAIGAFVLFALGRKKRRRASS